MKEQIKYGIFFDDDYDYLQHLKKPEMVVMEPVIAPGQGDDDQGTVSTVVCVCVCVCMCVRAHCIYIQIQNSITLAFIQKYGMIKEVHNIGIYEIFLTFICSVKFSAFESL